MQAGSLNCNFVRVGKDRHVYVRVGGNIANAWLPYTNRKIFPENHNTPRMQWSHTKQANNLGCTAEPYKASKQT